MRSGGSNTIEPVLHSRSIDFGIEMTFRGDLDEDQNCAVIAVSYFCS